MHEFDLSRIERELSEKSSIIDKLELWDSFIEGAIVGLITEGGKSDNTREVNVDTSNLRKVFGKNYFLIQPLFMPKHIYKLHVQPELNNPECTFWLLKHNAKEYFRWLLKDRHVEDNLNTPFSKEFIMGELSRLQEFEKTCRRLLAERVIDIYENRDDSRHKREIELLRIQSCYYKNHTLVDVNVGGNVVVELYAEHVLYKKYLKEVGGANIVSQNSGTLQSKPSMRTIALKYFYEGRSITRGNAAGIAKEYGWNSGQRLYQLFTYYTSRANRCGIPDPYTHKKIQNKINLFQSVIGLLNDACKGRALDEMSILIERFET